MNDRPAMIFDFDGTVALGDGPLRAYAREVQRRAGVDGIEAALDAPEAGLLDGYDVIRVAAERADVDPDVMTAAYRASRAVLGTADAPVHAPVGLAEFLQEAGERGVLRVLLTNAPADRLVDTLATLGLADGFDRIEPDGGKPAGLSRLLDELAQSDITDVLGVGDIWRNDLEPIAARGGTTALVGDFVAPAATPTFRASTLPELWPALRTWMSTRS